MPSFPFAGVRVSAFYLLPAYGCVCGTPDIFVYGHWDFCVPVGDINNRYPVYKPSQSFLVLVAQWILFNFIFPITFIIVIICVLLHIFICMFYAVAPALKSYNRIQKKKSRCSATYSFDVWSGVNRSQSYRCKCSSCHSVCSLILFTMELTASILLRGVCRSKFSRNFKWTKLFLFFE